MLRTIHLDTQTTWRGGQSQALLLMRGLIERGHSAELMAPRGAPLALRARQAGITVHHISSKFPRAHMAWALWRLSGGHRAGPAVRRSPNGNKSEAEIGPSDRRFDIIHAHDSHALAAAWLAGAYRRSTLIASRRVAYQLAKGRLALARYRAASRIIAVSRYVARSMENRGIEAARIAIAYDGVAVPPSADAERERLRIASRARWGIGEGECVLGCVSHLSPEKGQKVLLRALHLLTVGDRAGEFVPECGPQVPAASFNSHGLDASPRRYRLLMAGAGSDRKRLEYLARELKIVDRVVFTGFVEDVDSIYAALDIFVFPSAAEPLGSSLLDAMAYGLPCIAAASGGVPEVVEDGVNGVLVPVPGAPADFADAVARLKANPSDAARLGAAARETIIRRFSAANMVDSTLGVYEEASRRR